MVSWGLSYQLLTQCKSPGLVLGEAKSGVGEVLDKPVVCLGIHCWVGRGEGRVRGLDPTGTPESPCPQHHPFKLIRGMWVMLLIQLLF